MFSGEEKRFHFYKNTIQKKILDVACGTGDFSLAAMKLSPTEIVGVDIAEAMLTIGKEKIAKKNFQNIFLSLSFFFGNCDM